MGWLKRLFDLKDLKTLNLPPVRLQLTVRSQQLKLLPLLSQFQSGWD